MSAQVLVMQEKFVERVWLKRYPEGVPAEINPDQYGSLVEMFEESVTQFADQPALAVSQPPSRGARAGMKQMAPFR